ncbi:MAG: hypothetical protein GXO55_09605 [Chloroflexi bacterium]|nr:hypothetical protein [Chloroflexota bacterium]
MKPDAFRQRRQDRWVFIGMALLYALMATFYWRPIRVLAKPDEAAHLLYVYQVREGVLWPVWDPAPSGLWHVDERSQPPLYYWLAALVTAPTPVSDPHTWIEENPFFLHMAPYGNGARAIPRAEGAPFMYALRVFSWLLGLLVLAAAYRGARVWAPSPLAFLPGFLLLLTPTFLFLQTGITNTALAIVWATLLYGEMLAAWRRGFQAVPAWRWTLLLGLALYTRHDALFLLFPLFVLLLWGMWRGERVWPVVKGVGSALLLSLPLWVRNVWLYHDPLVRRALALRPEPLSWPTLFSSEAGRLFKTFFIEAGEGFILAPDVFYYAVGGFLILAGWGLARRGRGKGFDFLLSLFLPILVVAFFATRRYYIDAPRYLLTMGFPFFLLWAWGIYGWHDKRLDGLLLWGWGLLSAMVVLYVVLPVYEPRPARVSGPPQATFARGLHLYEARVLPGEGEWRIFLAWGASERVPKNYVVFVHAYNRAGELVAQEDTHPLYGAYPTSWWEPGFAWWDPHRLILPAGGCRDGLRIAIGLYDWETKQRLIPQLHDKAISSDGTVVIYPPQAIPRGKK